MNKSPISLVMMWPAAKAGSNKRGLAKSQTSFMKANNPHPSFIGAASIFIINEMVQSQLLVLLFVSLPPNQF